MVDRHRHQRLAYEFLIDHARSQQPFSREEFQSASQWSRASINTYLSKHLRDFIARPPRDATSRAAVIRIRHEFARVSLADFLHLASQNRTVYAAYQRVRYRTVLCFEFLLPLTREDVLREALDALFYKDTVVQRLHEIGLDKLEGILPRQPGTSDEEFVDSICRLVAEKFGGYSASHVNGRFRARDLLTLSEAGELLARGDRYLIDETTASVRFVIPCQRTELEYDADFDAISRAVTLSDTNALTAAETEEADVTRQLFFHLFVEAVVRTIHGEAEIWLIETGIASHLYVWERLEAQAADS